MQHVRVPDPVGCGGEPVVIVNRFPYHVTSRRRLPETSAVRFGIGQTSQHGLRPRSGDGRPATVCELSLPSMASWQTESLHAKSPGISSGSARLLSDNPTQQSRYQLEVERDRLAGTLDQIKPGATEPPRQRRRVMRGRGRSRAPPRAGSASSFITRTAKRRAGVPSSCDGRWRHRPSSEIRPVESGRVSATGRQDGAGPRRRK